MEDVLITPSSELAELAAEQVSQMIERITEPKYENVITCAIGVKKWNITIRNRYHVKLCDVDCESRDV